MSKLVTLEQSKKLKELGCKLLTHAYYSFDEKLRFHTGIYDWNTYASKDTYAVPTIAKALEWFREVKGIECGVLPSYYQCRSNTSVFYIFHWFCVEQNKKIEVNKSTFNYSTHSLAESALLDALIEYVSK